MDIAYPVLPHSQSTIAKDPKVSFQPVLASRHSSAKTSFLGRIDNAGIPIQTSLLPLLPAANRQGQTFPVGNAAGYVDAAIPVFGDHTVAAVVADGQANTDCKT